MPVSGRVFVDRRLFPVRCRRCLPLTALGLCEWWSDREAGRLSQKVDFPFVVRLLMPATRVGTAAGDTKRQLAFTEVTQAPSNGF